MAAEGGQTVEGQGSWVAAGSRHKMVAGEGKEGCCHCCSSNTDVQAPHTLKAAVPPPLTQGVLHTTSGFHSASAFRLEPIPSF